MKDQVLTTIKDLLDVRTKVGDFKDREKIEAAVALLHAIIAEPPVGGVKASPAPPRDDVPQVSFLEWREVDKREPARIKSYCIGKGQDGYVTIGGLTEREVDTLAGMTVGTNHVLMRNGRVYSWAAYEPVPEPIEDPIIGPHWNKSPKGQEKIGGFPPGEGWHSPTIYVSDPQSKVSIEKLESYGAVCMRSRRGLNGKFWETWMVLPWRMDGSLKRHIEVLEQESKERTNKLLDWTAKAEAIAQHIARNVSAGSIDIVIQRYALVFD